ncbi:MAG: suppressor of fused domain protein [Clostridium sp.]|nr:suppressor of fused domain protein [Clostridium sp.]
MTLLEQCQRWNKNDEFQKIIDALEKIPAEERTPEEDSELARAYNNLAQPGEKELFQKAIALLEPHEEYFAGDHSWNFRMGYAYYYLDQEGPALHYFEQALAARPGDEDTEELIEDCRSRLVLPRFDKNFRERTEEAWAAFAEIEEELRSIMDSDTMRERGEELMEQCSAALELAFHSPAFELGFNGGKYELILSAEGVRSSLFPLVYFKRHAPEPVREHWNILVGRQPSKEFILRTGETEIQAEDVQTWARQEDGRIFLTLWCEKLIPLMREDESRAWWILYTLVDQTLGEISSVALIGRLDITEQPPEEPSFLLSELPQTLLDMGCTLWDDAESYLDNSYVGYEMKPVEDPEADWRFDVFSGSARLPVLINEYMSGESETADEYHMDGIAAGFLYFPLEGFSGENRAEQILKFRDALQEAVRDQAGDDAADFLGGATGLYYGYLDFIAWDLPAVLNAARDFFAGTELACGGFHVFRRGLGAVRLWEQEKEPQIDPETGSLLTAEDIENLEAFDDGIAGYFGKMLQYLEDFVKRGVETGKFTERQARQDLQIALWYSFACSNLDEYRYYYKAAQWMPDSEKNAKGCATWYYRYSVALTYCGRLEEALDYAEQGTKEEPDYPWIWLQAGKLRAHFGDREGALEAAARGLLLEPGDYEFLTLKKEIEAGEPLERMEYHWINPGADQALQQGRDEDAENKQRSISCITVNQEGLERFWEIFGPKPKQYVPNAPYTQFPYTVKGSTIDLVFQMNEAGMSKLNADWLRQVKSWLSDGRWLERNHPDGRAAKLNAALVGLDCQIGLFYQLCGAEEYFQIFLRPDGTEIEGSFWSSEEGRDTAFYTEEEMDAVERHIAACFGTIENVFHELVSPDIHVDVCMIPPEGERDYVTLVTMGMGARPMNVPEELAEYKLERVELAIALPPDWKLDQESMKDEKWYWPVRLLKTLARLPIVSDTWLGWGHTVDHKKPFAENTKLCAAVLTEPKNIEENGFICQLPGDRPVNFYQVIPLYREELEYKIKQSAQELLEIMAEAGFVAEPDRRNYAEEK